MRIRFIARRAAALAVVATAALAPAAQADVLANWGTHPTVSHEVRGLAVDPQGDVYVADPVTSRISVFTRDGAPLRSWGEHGSGPGKFDDLSRVAVGPDGDIYATDASSVQRFSRDGVLKARWGTWGKGPGQFRYAAGIAVAADGTVYVVDRWNRRVQAFTADGDFLRVVIRHDDHDDDDHETTTTATTAASTSTTRAASRSPRTAPSSSPRTTSEFVAHLTPEGGVIKTWSAPEPIGVAVAPDGSVLATDGKHNIVRAPRRTARRSARWARASRPRPSPASGWSSPPASPPTAAAPSTSPTGRRSASTCSGTPGCSPRRASTSRSRRRRRPLRPIRAPSRRPRSPASARRRPSPRSAPAGVGEPVSGRVLVQLPGEGRFTTLRKRSKLPVGTTVDVTDGVVRVTFATAPEDVPTYGPTQSAEFWGGEFRFFQAADGSLVDVILTGDQPDCVIGAGASAKSKGKEKTKSSRFVWGKRQGQVPHHRQQRRGHRARHLLVHAGPLRRHVLPHPRGRGRRPRLRQAETVPVKAGQRYLARVPCASRRNFDIKLQVPAGQSVADATVRVNGKRVRVRGGAKPKVRVDLRGRPKQRIRVRIDLTLSNGETLSGVREYRTCTVRVSDGTPPRL